MKRHLPAVLYLAGAVAILLGVVFPLWRVLLYFPQYPEGPLQVVAYAGAITGDLTELDMLNDYIGVRFPHDIPELAILPKVLVAIAGWTLLAGLVRGRLGVWCKGLSLAGLATTGVGMLWRINGYLTEFGARPDPNAPLAGVMKPFKPPLWGRAVIVQVEAVAEFLNGTYFLAAAVVLLLLGFWLALRTRNSREDHSCTSA